MVAASKKKAPSFPPFIVGQKSDKYCFSTLHTIDEGKMFSTTVIGAVTRHGSYSQGVLRISSEGNNRMGENIKTPPKCLGPPTKPPKLPGPKANPQKSHAEFPSLKNFQKGLNNGFMKQM